MLQLVGLTFLLSAGLVNTLAFFWLHVGKESDSELRKQRNRASYLLLFNIPIAAIYLYSALMLLSFMRVTFVNNTPRTLTNIKIKGCEKGIIPSLETSEKTTKWIKLNDGCSIHIQYNLAGEAYNETVVGYATSIDGLRLQHVIDGGYKNNF